MQYQEATFIAENGRTYNLADEVHRHLVRIVNTEQEAHERQTGQQEPQPRRRPSIKKRSEDA